MKRTFLYGMFLSGALLCPEPGHAADGHPIDAFTLYTEDHPPINFPKDGSVRGITVDLLVDLLGRIGAGKGRADIIVIPWARGFTETLERPNTMIFGADRTPAREHQFKWVGPIMRSHIALMARKDRGIRIFGPSDFRLYTAGIMRKAAATEAFMAAGVPEANVVRLTSPRHAAAMLGRGRVDIWPYESVVAFWVLREEGFDPAAFEAVWSLTDSHYYYAFNRATDDTIIKALQQALDAARRDGTLARIIDSYIPGRSTDLMVMEGGDTMPARD